MKHQIIKVLDVYNLPFDESFLSPDGLVLVAQLCNWAAKTVSSSFYNIKEFLIDKAMRIHNNCWYDQNQQCVYFETGIGQVSFHVFDDYNEFEFDLLPGPDSNEKRCWSGIPNQHMAYEMAVFFLLDESGEEYIPSRYDGKLGADRIQ